MGLTHPLQVIIVDDHRLFREGLRLILKGMNGVDIVAEAANGIQAIELIDKLKPDIAIVDITIPQLNGLNLLTVIKQKSPETKALMLTNSTDEDAIIKALMAGAKGYLSKDASVSCLLNAIKVIDNGELWVERKLIAKYFNDAANSNSVQQEPRKKANQALTPREKEVLHLLTEGKTNKEIAQKLFISEKTVKSHLNRIFKKFNVTRRLEAILYAIKQGLS